MAKKPTFTKTEKRAVQILKLLKKRFPGLKCALDFTNPLELLVATILSAQCTDKRVNMVTPALFKRYRTAKDYANANMNELRQMIHSTGFYRNKAKSIQDASQMIVEKFGGKVPKSLEELTQLHGVARKTANVVLSVAFKINEGVVVDTHVRRVSARLALTFQNDPNKIEQDLMKFYPRKEWGNFSLLMIQHGREICFARKPDCASCPLNRLCPSAFTF